MKLKIAAVGRLRTGPEADLFSDYISRFEKIGRNLGLGPVEIIEVDAKGKGMNAEGELLLKALPAGAPICALDERGKQMSSIAFSGVLSDWRDSGAHDPTFVIGGADGLAKDVRQRAAMKLSFGSMVWPHMLVRVMLAEQLYRAASILSGSPYHRE